MENRREMMTEKKEKYIKPEMEIIEFEVGDVITSSCTAYCADLNCEVNTWPT